MHRWKNRIIAAMICGTGLPAVHAAEPVSVPVEAIEILPISFATDGLGEAGGDRLRAALDGAQFIALGEDHGFAGSPALGDALAHDAAAIAARTNAGPLYHVVEVGPLTTKWVSARLAEGGLDALAKALAGRPYAMPFLSNVEDARLALPFAAGGRLWGIDQEFIGAPSILLDELAARSKDAATRGLLAKWREGDRTALASGKFDAVMTSVATPNDFADLRARFIGDARSLAIIDALAASAHIYQLNDSGQYLLNNEVRADYMRDTFLAAYRAAPTKAPVILFKMGAYHVGRGTTPTAIVDIGSLLPGLAAANGKTAIAIAYVPLAGQVRTVKPSTTGFTVIEPYVDEAVGPILDAVEIARDGLPATGHILIPLAPLRHRLAGKKLRDLPAFSRFLLQGFDYLVTTRDARPATHFEAQIAD